MIPARSLSRSTSTSKCSRSRSTPAGAIASRTRTRCVTASRDPRVLVRLERRRHGDAALDVNSEIHEHDLDRGEHRRDVEDVEPADVAETEDLAEQVALPVRDRHAE